MTYTPTRARYLAKALDGIEYGPITDDMKEHFTTMKDNNCVVVVGQSDDIMAFYGARRDEFYPTFGGFIYFDHAFEGELDFEDHPSAPWYIEAVFGEDGVTWQYKTNIPGIHTFRVMEDGEVYCIGFVFDLEHPNMLAVKIKDGTQKIQKILKGIGITVSESDLANSILLEHDKSA